MIGPLCVHEMPTTLPVLMHQEPRELMVGEIGSVDFARKPCPSQVIPCATTNCSLCSLILTQTRHYTAPMHAPLLQYWIQLPFEQQFGVAKTLVSSTAVTMLTSKRKCVPVQACVRAHPHSISWRYTDSDQQDGPRLKYLDYLLAILNLLDAFETVNSPTGTGSGADLMQPVADMC